MRISIVCQLSMLVAFSVAAAACGSAQNQESELPDLPSDNSVPADARSITANLDCYVGAKQPGKAPCTLTAGSPCQRAVIARASKLLETSNYSELITAVSTTPDEGTFQYAQTDLGLVGIYCHPNRTAKRAHVVYGEILQTWASHGWETWDAAGYPQSDESDAQGLCAEQGGVREQRFESKQLGGGPLETLTYLCWSPSRGTWLIDEPGIAVEL